MQLLWPPPRPAALTRRRGIRPAGARYTVIPSAQRPKLLVPSRPRRVAAGALRNFKTAATGREQLQISTLALALRLGAHDWLPDHVVVPPGCTGIETRLSTVLDRQVHVSLYIGPARAVRKPVLQVLDDRGRTIAFAKLGVDEFTTRLVRAEAAAVAEVTAAQRATLALPELLHVGEWNGHALLVQSALPRGAAATASSPGVSAAVLEIARVRGLTTSPLATSSYWTRLSAAIDALPAGPIAERLARALDEIAAMHADTPLDFGCSHGDFAPWNMTLAGERVLVWDWEKFEADVPVGFDAVHCAVQGGVVLGGATPAAAFAAALERAAGMLAPVGNGAAAELVVWLYAVDIATRYLVDREQDAGQTRMTDLAAWLPRVLDERAAAGSRL